MAKVIIGGDPHKRAATIKIINQREQAVGQGRYGTDRDGYRTMLGAGRKHTDRVWAVEGCSGIGRHVAQRLVADGETVLDVPAKLSARARVFATGQAARPTRSMPAASRWSRCAPPACARLPPTTPLSDWGCSSPAGPR